MKFVQDNHAVRSRELRHRTVLFQQRFRPSYKDRRANRRALQVPSVAGRRYLSDDEAKDSREFLTKN